MYQGAREGLPKGLEAVSIREKGSASGSIFVEGLKVREFPAGILRERLLGRYAGVR